MYFPLQNVYRTCRRNVHPLSRKSSPESVSCFCDRIHIHSTCLFFHTIRRYTCIEPCSFQLYTQSFPSILCWLVCRVYRVHCVIEINFQRPILSVSVLYNLNKSNKRVTLLLFTWSGYSIHPVWYSIASLCHQSPNLLRVVWSFLV